MTKTSTTTPEQNKSASMPTRPAAAKRPAKRPRVSAQMPSAPGATAAVPARKTTKRDQLAALLVRDEGAKLDQMIAATGWLPHTTRAALTGLRKAGYVIDGDKIDGIRTYRAVAPK
ncbi:MAG: DUF3489 domain-containing protein [Sphingomicrobium sp.]